LLEEPLDYTKQIENAYKNLSIEIKIGQLSTQLSKMHPNTTSFSVFTHLCTTLLSSSLISLLQRCYHSSLKRAGSLNRLVRDWHITISSKIGHEMWHKPRCKTTKNWVTKQTEINDLISARNKMTIKWDAIMCNAAKKWLRLNL